MPLLLIHAADMHKVVLIVHASATNPVNTVSLLFPGCF